MTTASDLTHPTSPPRTLRPGPPPEVLELPEPGGPPHLWRLYVPEYPVPREEALSVLDAEERKRHGAFVRDSDRARYAAAHLGLRRLLGRYLRTRPDAVVLDREPCPLCAGPHGRPRVAGSGPHFSLSHSGDLVLLAFAAVPVGVDVEEMPRATAVAQVSGSLHPGEQAELAALPPAERPAAFLRCWTRKEAYLKGTGEGLPGDPALRYVGTGALPAAVPGWSLADIPVDAGYAAALAVPRSTA